ELLGQMLEKSRRGDEIRPNSLERLRRIQDQVEKKRIEGQAWDKGMPTELSSIEKDVLACAIAPEAVPRLGWMFQSLQPGHVQPYPTPALLQELFALTMDEANVLYAAIGDASPLRQHNLIEIEGGGNDPFSPLRPTSGVTNRLLGRPVPAGNLPGTMMVKIGAQWDDLVLPGDRMAMLHEFLLWINHKTTVVEKWGGKDCGGPVALFSGPSGTGKTFAAAVIATELGWPLYRVDLGSLVSKYIGETEKNLNRLFDAAHGQPMILQFDEADSLFSKRGNIKEARDRYANMEVSHLLSRIESHHGPVILTTNLRSHLDAAFARRFQIVVDFPRPDATARKFLWQRLLPPRAPRLPEVDPAFLGASVNLTGGNILNAALHAAYLAAGENQPISLRQVALAVWREIGKDGRELSSSDLGPLARYLPRRKQCW
ncbi:MAG TPA: ATP-binding protein, partial [Desulfobulbaceae bacterium]|nr:ATP-binding protein [Desulfobulbaceae bacterium]